MVNFLSRAKLRLRMEQRELLNPEDLEKPTVAASRSRSWEGQPSLRSLNRAALYCGPVRRSRKMFLKNSDRRRSSDPREIKADCVDQAWIDRIQPSTRAEGSF